VQKITNFRSALHYSFGKPQLPPRELDLYTEGVQLNLLNYETLDAKVLNGSDMSLDDTDLSSIKDDIFYNVDNTFKFISSCDYGCTTGNFYEGMKCVKCGTMVKAMNPDISQFRSMFRLHEPYPMILHPIAYRVFHAWLGRRKGIFILESILLIKKNFPIELKEAGFEHGLTAFQRDFDRIIDFLLTKSKFVSTDMLKRGTNIREFIQKYRDCIFIRNVPILNKSLHIITSKKKSKDPKKSKKEKIFTDSQVGLIMQMYHILSDTRFTIVTDRETSNRRATIDKSIMKFAMTYYSYLDEIVNKKLSKKKGFIQQNIVAGRFDNTFRGVISPIVGIHEGDELHIPWTTGVCLWKREIINLLRNRFNYSYEDALMKHFKAVDEYDTEIHRIMDTLILECPYKGMPTMWDRNPTLNIGSNQLLFITKVKADIRDKTISMSQMIVKAPNADSTQGPLMSNLQVKTSLIAGNLIKRQSAAKLYIYDYIPYGKYIIHKPTN